MLDGTFPEDLKTTEVERVYKTKKRTHENNYRLLTILSNISKIYENSFYKLLKKRLVMKVFIFSQFNYCPLEWMCHSRKLNNKLSR